MRVELTRIDNRTHRLRVVRDDGSGDEAVLETRSLLLHDLVHYAVEAELPIEDGFWGSVAAGASFDSLREPEGEMTGGLALAETLVGPMQSVWHERTSGEAYVSLFRERDERVDDDFLARVRARLRHLWGHWKATGFHETMTLAWPPA